ncbi:MAG: hypothetical protein WLagBPW_03530 [Shewanella algae]
MLNRLKTIVENIQGFIAVLQKDFTFLCQTQAAGRANKEYSVELGFEALDGGAGPWQESDQAVVPPATGCPVWRFR